VALWLFDGVGGFGTVGCGAYGCAFGLVFAWSFGDEDFVVVTVFCSWLCY
jgi:hypothetical protein